MSFSETSIHQHHIMKRPPALQITLPRPCAEQWDVMRPTVEGRFCSRCQHAVTDFTGMSDAQIAHAMLTAEGKICGRLRVDQIQRDLQLPVRPPQRQWPKLAVAAMLALAATPHFLLAQTTSSTQPQTTVVQTAPLTSSQRDTLAAAQAVATSDSILVKVLDAKTKQTVPFVTIAVPGLIDPFYTDQTGMARLSIKELMQLDTITIAAGAREYLSNEVTLDAKVLPQTIEIELSIETQRTLMGMMEPMIVLTHENYNAYRKVNREFFKKYKIKRPPKIRE